MDGSLFSGDGQKWSSSPFRSCKVAFSTEKASSTLNTDRGYRNMHKGASCTS